MIREFLKHLSLELNRSRLTVQAYETDLLGFNEFIVKSGVPCDDAGFFIPSRMSIADVREWMAELSEKGMSPVSIRRKIQALRAYFKFLMKRGIVHRNPAEGVALPKPARKLPSIASHSDIRTAIDKALSPEAIFAVEMLYACGLRRSELLNITDNDINFFSRELKILGKGNKHRIIPLPEPLIEKIRKHQTERNRLYPDLPAPRPLMATRRGRMGVSTLYRMVKETLSATDAEKKSPHTLRHSFATQLLNAGADINSVKGLLGHSSLGATQIYTHLAFSELNREWAKAHPRAKK